MSKNERAIGMVAGALALVLSALPSFASVDKCSKFIDGESLKMQSAALKGFQKCNDAYYKDLLKPVSPAFSKAAGACEKELAKVLNTIAAEVTKLAAGAPKTCTDSDLIAGGHMPTTPFGSRWAQFQGIAALQYAYEQQLTGTRDWVNILITVGNTGSCPTCKKLNVPPCNNTACVLADSKATVKLANFPITVPLTGMSVLQICDPSQVISSATGVFFVMAQPGKILDPSPVSTIATACTRTISAEGVIFCGAGSQKIDYTTCVDHSPSSPNVSGAPSSGACNGQSCSRTQLDKDTPQPDPGEDDNHLNGGTCITFTSSSGAPGDAYVTLTSQIGLAPPQGSAGSDCLNTSLYTSQGTPAGTPLTTGSAEATVKNADGLDGADIVTDPISSTGRFDCAGLSFGKSGAVNLVGAFPSVNSLAAIPPDLSDQAITFSLQCQ